MPALREDPLPAADIAPSDQLEAQLFALLGLVNDWLKFAETKNGVVLTVSAAALALLLDTLDGVSSVPALTWIFTGTGGTCLLLSVLAGLLSFFPRTNVPRLSERRVSAAAESDNLYYFEHLARYGPDTLAREINRRYLPVPSDSIGEASLALAAQIVINARITLWKLNLFSFAMTLFGAGFVLSVIGVGVMIIT